MSSGMELYWINRFTEFSQKYGQFKTKDGVAVAAVEYKTAMNNPFNDEKVEAALGIDIQGNDYTLRWFDNHLVIKKLN